MKGILVFLLIVQMNIIKCQNKIDSINKSFVVTTNGGSDLDCLNINLTTIDSSTIVYEYCLMFNESITWFLDSVNSTFYICGARLVNTSTTNGNNEISIFFKKITLLSSVPKVEFEISVISNQSYGNFKKVVIEKENLNLYLNSEVVKSINLTEFKMKEFEDFLNSN